MAYPPAQKGAPLSAALTTPQFPPGSVFAQLLDSLGTSVRDRYYKGQTIHLNGYTFVNCCFHNCTLVTETGIFTIDSCTIAGCHVLFGANAIRLIRLFNMLDGFSSNAPFNPDISANGSVTIK